ncbi:hypothetical protein EVAR_13410_1 [Eumeta japonica]|uniref:Uncharacterized protein n=1 Tax=Eumeta variegata TaxID=151549 RepID=A0A4C1V642_EUMVA|nr:hypothetical protein EVAR_13410_1 [Eumeta japonica]
MRKNHAVVHLVAVRKRNGSPGMRRRSHRRQMWINNFRLCLLAVSSGGPLPSPPYLSTVHQRIPSPSQHSYLHQISYSYPGRQHSGDSSGVVFVRGGDQLLILW